MKGPYLLNLTDDTYKKLLIYIQFKVIYDDKIYFWKILTSIQMKPSTLILAFFTIVMYGESRGNWAKNPVAKYYHYFKIMLEGSISETLFYNNA